MVGGHSQSKTVILTGVAVIFALTVGYVGNGREWGHFVNLLLLEYSCRGTSVTLTNRGKVNVTDRFRNELSTA